MRIAYISGDPGIPVFGHKGASIHIQEVIRALLRRHHQVTLFTPRPGGPPPADLNQVELVTLPQVGGENPSQRERAARQLDLHMADLLVEAGPFDLVYERYTLWNAAAQVRASELGVPSVLEVNSPLIEEQARHRHLVDRAAAVEATARAFGAASAIVAVSNEVANWVEGFLPDANKVAVIPNGVDPSRFDPTNRPRHLDRFTIGFVGTLKPWHDLDTLITAFARLAASDPCYHLLIVGDGPERADLEARLELLSLTSRVQMAGSVPPGAIPALLSRMDVAVAPYPSQPGCYFSPLKLFEYMAAGVPVVGAAIGQVAEVIESGRTGLLYRPGDAAHLAADIAGLRADPAMRQSLADAGRALVASHTWDDVVGQTLSLVPTSQVGTGESRPPDGQTRWKALRTRLRMKAPAEGFKEGLAGFRKARRVFLPHLRGQWLLILGGILAMLAEVGFRLLEPWPLKLILDRVIQPDPAAAATGLVWADRLDPATLLVISAGGFVAFTALRALTAYASTVAFALAGNRILTAVRARLYQHLQRLSLSFHTRARTGDLLTRVTSDIGRLQEVAVTAALPLFVNLTTFAGMTAVMLWMDWRLALVALTAVPLFVMTLIRLGSQIRTVARKQRQTEGALASVAAESLGAIEVIQAYSLEQPFAASFGSQNQRSLRDGVRAKRLAAALERRTDIFVAVATGLVLFLGARLVLSGALTPGDLIVFITYLKTAFKPMRDIAKFTGRIAKAGASAERIAELLRTDPEVTDDPQARPAPALRGDIRFEEISLSYGDGTKAIAELDLHIPEKARVAVVGPSGAGKSSLIGLLLRLYQPQQGRITIDGFDIQTFTLESLRRQIAVVLQDSVLFHATIGENIAFGNLTATQGQIERAARLAYAHGFITALPDGYDTVVGERGATLSGGERQRIAIARALLRQAPIVILDEPTRGLDQEAAASVLRALDNLMEGRTVIHVTHDLAAIETSDLIFYLDRGRLEEAGTHLDLVATPGAYRQAHIAKKRIDAGEP